MPHFLRYRLPYHWIVTAHQQRASQMGCYTSLVRHSKPFSFYVRNFRFAAQRQKGFTSSFSTGTWVSTVKAARTAWTCYVNQQLSQQKLGVKRKKNQGSDLPWKGQLQKFTTPLSFPVHRDVHDLKDTSPSLPASRARYAIAFGLLKILNINTNRMP